MIRLTSCALALLVAVAACGDRSGSDGAASGSGGFGSLADVQLQVSPAAVSFGGISQGNSADAVVRITHVGTSGALILRAARLESASAEITATLPKDTALGPGESVEIIVHYMAADDAADKATLFIEHDSTSEKSPLVIPITTGDVAGVLRVSPQLVDFGAVATGAHADRTASVTNVGSGNVTVTAVALEGDAIEDFAVVTPPALPAVLAPGDSVSVGLRYTPTWWNGDTATLVFTADGAVATAPVLGSEIGPKIVVTPPDKVALGSAQVGDQVTRSFKVLSQGNAALHVTSLALLDGAEPGLELVGAPGDEVVVQPGEKIETTVRFKPTKALAPDSLDPIGTIRVLSDDPIEPQIDVPVYAWSGYPILAVLPAEQVHFGVAAQTIRIERKVTLVNQGFAPLEVSEIRLTAATDAEFEITGDPSFGPLSTPPVADWLPAGATVELTVSYTNFGAAEGEAHGGLAVHSDDEEHPVWVLDLYALRAGPAECKPVIVPTKLDFGPLSEGSSRVATVNIKNEGSGFCTFESARIVDCPADLPLIFNCIDASSSPWFSLAAVPESVPAGIEPKGTASIQIMYEAPPLDAEVSWLDVRGLLLVDISDPHSGDAVTTLPAPFTQELEPVPNLLGASALGLLSVNPSKVAFGITTLGCKSQTQTVSIANKGEAPLWLDDIALEGCGPEVTILDQPALPHELWSDSPTGVKIVYAPQDLGSDACTLIITAGGQTATLSLTGSGTLETHVTDVYDKVFDGVDVLFVVDDSGSMSEDQQNLATNFESFLSEANNWGVDFHLGVTTTDVEDATKAGRLQGEPRFVTPADAQAFAKNVIVGTNGSGTERGLEAARLALSPPLTDDLGTPCDGDIACAAPMKCVKGTCGGPNRGFLRDSAALHLIFVSDEEDQSPKALSAYIDFFKGLKGEGWGELIKAHAIVGTKTLTCGADIGKRYIDVAEATDGHVASICDPDFAAALGDLSGGIFGAQYKYHLSRFPVATTLKVTVNGAPCSSGWSFDAASVAVVFKPTSPCMPQPGDVVTIDYDAMCFQ